MNIIYTREFFHDAFGIKTTTTNHLGKRVLTVLIITFAVIWVSY